MASAKSEEGKPWFEMSTAQVMEVIGVSRMSLTNFSDAGMPKLAHGSYDVRAVVQWYLTREQEKFSAKLANLGSEEAETRYRLAKAESAELDLAVKRGELVPVERVKSFLETRIGSVRTKFAAVPDRMATRVLAALPRGRHEVKAILQEVVYEVADELAGVQSTSDGGSVAPTLDGRRAQRVASAKKAKPVRVGRHKKSNPSRRKSDRARTVENVKG